MTLYDLALTASDIIYEHSAVILAFCLGALIALGIWWHEHPEDFFHRFRRQDDEPETLNADPDEQSEDPEPHRHAA